MKRVTIVFDVEIAPHVLVDLAEFAILRLFLLFN